MCRPSRHRPQLESASSRRPPSVLARSPRVRVRRFGHSAGGWYAILFGALGTVSAGSPQSLTVAPERRRGRAVMLPPVMRRRWRSDANRLGRTLPSLTLVGAAPARACCPDALKRQPSAGLIGEGLTTRIRPSAAHGFTRSLPADPSRPFESRLVDRPAGRARRFKNRGGRRSKGRRGAGWTRVTAASATGHQHCGLSPPDRYAHRPVGSAPNPGRGPPGIHRRWDATVPLDRLPFATAGAVDPGRRGAWPPFPVGGRLSEIIPAVINDGVRCDAAFGHGFGHTLHVPDHAPEPRSLASGRLTVGFGACREAGLRQPRASTCRISFNARMGSSGSAPTRPCDRMRFDVK